MSWTTLQTASDLRLTASVEASEALLTRCTKPPAEPSDRWETLAKKLANTPAIPSMAPELGFAHGKTASNLLSATIPRPPCFSLSRSARSSAHGGDANKSDASFSTCELIVMDQMNNQRRLPCINLTAF